MLDFLKDLFVDRGMPEESARFRAITILPYYYSWAQGKGDEIKSDIHKFSLFTIYKTLLFPEMFKEKENLKKGQKKKIKSKQKK